MPEGMKVYLNPRLLFVRNLRYYEYYANKEKKSVLTKLKKAFHYFLHKHLSYKLGFTRSHPSLSYTQKSCKLVTYSFLRKERDSNPRRCDPQRFSRPSQSTTLPSFQL